MRRFTLLVLVLIAMMMSLQAQSKFEVDGICYEKYANTAGSVYVTYKGSDYFTPSYSGVVTIPDKVTSNGETYDVVGIGCGAFYGCDVLEVNLPQSLLEVDMVSFYGCSSLSAITLPDNVVSIGAASFMGCENLSTVNMNSKLEDIREYAFYGTRVSHIELPKTMEYISGNTFIGMNHLESINVAEENPNFCSIEGVLYNKNKSEILAIPILKLENFVIPDFVTTLGGNVFYGSKQEEIIIPATVSEMSRLTFTNMPNLKKVTVNKENAHYYDIDGVPFVAGTEELMIFPKGRTETNYIVPEGTKKIGALAFDGFDKLKEITIPGSVECIGDSAFNNCCDLQQLHFNEGNLKSIGINAFRGCMDMLSFTIPNTVTHLGRCAFFDCGSMSELVIGSSVESIGLGCCVGADNLRNVYVLNTVPPTFQEWNSDSFSQQTYTEGTLYVPEGCVDAYRNAPEWKNFSTVTEHHLTGVKAPCVGEKPLVRVVGGDVVIDNPVEGSKVEIYDIVGRSVYSGTDKVVALPGNGLYVVKVGNATTKVMR